VKVAVVGAGWAGCAAAVEAAQLGHIVTLFEASRSLGGRARRVGVEDQALDNGQHILIGAYSECLRLMQTVGVSETAALRRMQLNLCFPDGVELSLPQLPAPLHVLGGILLALGLTLNERWVFLTRSLAWKNSGWRCSPGTSVAQLTAPLPDKVRERFTDLLCVSALNTSPDQADGQVFLNVLRDSLGAQSRSSDFLLPKVDLTAVFPASAAKWLESRSASVRLGDRVNGVTLLNGQWQVTGQASNETFDTVIIATPPAEAARLLAAIAPGHASQIESLRYEPITTVYLHAPGTRLHAPMLALHETPTQPAQFVFDRGQLGNAAGMLALVVSASSRTREWTDEQWLACAREALEQWRVNAAPTLLKAITEKRATFACTVGLQRPAMAAARGLLLAGDYVAGPYPSTLEGAVRSGVAAARAIANNAN
jgi:squalene-associated FAD-dependent desaturase